jgi:hypothetical protein
MFKKLDVKLDDLDWSNIVGQGGWNVGNGYRLYEYTTTVNPYLLLKDKIRFNIYPSTHNIAKIVHPGTWHHNDAFPTALNIYLDVSDDVTYFWDFKDTHHVPKMGDPIKKHDPENLKVIGSFTAKKYDCYLLQTNLIHSVDSSNSDIPRCALRFIWNHHTFDEIKDTIEIL